MKVIVTSLIFFLSALTVQATPRVLMFIPNDFMWPEYSEPKSLYEKAGFKVTTTAKFKEAIYPDRRNLKDYADAKAIHADLTFEDVKVDDYDAITFVAGNGAWHDFFPNQKVHDLLIEAFQKNKVIGLICASTGLLGLAGNFDGKSKTLAQGKEVVGYFRVEGILKNMGKVKYIAGGQKEPGVAIDGNLVTGRNPESSKLFGEKIVETLMQTMNGKN
jgi:protease I